MISDTLDSLYIKLGELGAPLILAETGPTTLDGMTPEDILALALSQALDQPRLYNILPFTIFKNRESLNWTLLLAKVSDPIAYATTGYILELLKTITNAELPQLDLRQLPEPVIAFKDIYGARGLLRIENSAFPLAIKWGILIDSSFSAELEKIKKWT